ncbi:MAG: STT3 domain-containing protein [Candidatus Hadarchaeales archaeon]
MNVKRLAVVLYLLSLMVLSFSILLVPGKNGDTLNTSDSGFFFGIAREIERQDGMVERYSLSHGPTGWSITPREQGQPLMLVMLYRALHSLDSDVSLMDACRLWSPLILALSLIPAFLVGRELWGEVAGAVAALLLALMTNLTYWCKVGAFDREALQTLLTLWAVFLSLRMLKARSFSSALWWGGLAGGVLGLFALSWEGWWYLLPAIVVAPLIGVGAGFLEHLWKKRNPGEAVLSSTREHLHQALGLLVLLSVLGAVVYALGGGGLDYWRGVFLGLWSYLPSRLSLAVGAGAVMVGLYFWWEASRVRSRVGMGWLLFSLVVGSLVAWAWSSGGGGGLVFTRYASEMRPFGSWREIFPQFYAGLERAGDWVFILVVLGFSGLMARRVLGSSREGRGAGDFLPFVWLVVLMGLVWPEVGQARFIRQWWPFVAVMAGVGVGLLVSLIKRISTEPWAPSMDWSRTPLLLALCGALAVSPLVSNAYRFAERTTPPTEWEMGGLDSGLVETFSWLRENSPENSVVAVEWSYGHLLTGVSERNSVCDGVESTAQEGAWENDPVRYPIRPPDFVYRVEGNRALIYGGDTPRKEWAINGRRTDVQWFPLIGVDELEWYLRTYSDNYGCRIDYLVFHAGQYWEAYYYKTRDAPLSKVLGAGRLATRLRSSPAREEGGWILDFSENRKNVVLTDNGEVYLRTESGDLYLDGVAYISLDEKGQPQAISFRPPDRVDLRETLVLFFFGENLAGAWLVRGVSEAIQAIPDPVGMLVFTSPGSIPYLQQVYRSSNGLVLLFRVDWERLGA